MIDKFVIDRLEATPIEGVAESLGMQVERHKCLCPFHDDSRPSLTFNTYRNRYRCYVCDAHGGVIDLVRNYKGVGFREACEWLGYDSSADSGGGYAGSRPTKTGFPRALGLAPCSSTVFVGSVPAPQEPPVGGAQIVSATKKRPVYPPDLEWLSKLVSVKVLNEEARRFLFEERRIDPRVVQWCGLTSIAQPTPCWRYGKPFYDAPSLLIPYYDVDGRLVSVQSRYLGTGGPKPQEKNVCSDDGRAAIALPDNSLPNSLGKQASQPVIQPTIHSVPEPSSAQTQNSSVPTPQKIAAAPMRLHKMEPAGAEIPRFKFPRGTDCHVYGLQILRMLRPGEELWITEGCSDCWAMLSSGKKAIAIPSATLLKDKDIEPLRGLNLHMYPDQDRPGERLFLELRERLPQLQRHQLPTNCKDFGEYWKNTNNHQLTTI